MFGCVCRCFVAVSHWICIKSWQTFIILHELAHAYHHQFLLFNNKKIIEAYNNARKKRIYKEVQHINGGIVTHYALVNHKEYFAESTEAYFGENDLYPFNRENLKDFDHQTYELIEELWGVKKTDKQM